MLLPENDLYSYPGLQSLASSAVSPITVSPPFSIPNYHQSAFNFKSFRFVISEDKNDDCLHGQPADFSCHYTTGLDEILISSTFGTVQIHITSELCSSRLRKEDE